MNKGVEDDEVDYVNIEENEIVNVGDCLVGVVVEVVYFYYYLEMVFFFIY